MLIGPRKSTGGPWTVTFCGKAVPEVAPDRAVSIATWVPWNADETEFNKQGVY